MHHPAFIPNREKNLSILLVDISTAFDLKSEHYIWCSVRTPCTDFRNIYMRNRVDTFIILIKVHCWSSIKRPFCAWRYQNCKNQRRRMPSSHCQCCFVPVLVSRFKSSSRYSWLECKVNPDGGSNQDSVHNPKLTCLRSQYRSLPCSYMISSFWHKKCAGLGVGRGRTCKPRVSAVRPSCHPRTAVNTLFFGYRVLLNLPKTYSTAIELTIELFFSYFQPWTNTL